MVIEPRSPSPGSPSPDPVPFARRLHHLDALRGGALLLGILLHALMPYLPGGFWLVADRDESVLALLTVGVIHLFRMALFMMLAGYFGHLVLHRRGTHAYLRDRLVRTGLPLPTLGPPLFALLVLALILDSVARGPREITEAPGRPDAATGLLAVPTMHLWFLLLLLEIVLVVVLTRALLLRLLGTERAGRLSQGIGTLLASPAGLLLMALPYALGLLAQGDAMASLTEPTTLVPVAGASIAYAGAFLTGWFLRAAPDALPRTEAGWHWHLLLALVLTPVALLLPPTVPALAVAAPAALAAWAWVLGLMGLCGRVVRREIGWVRYLADASYWMYLLHLPMLLLVAVPLALVDLPVPLEVGLALGTVSLVLLLSYDGLVRSTWLGAWLTGHRHPRALLRRRRGGTAREETGAAREESTESPPGLRDAPVPPRPAGR